MHGPQTGPHCNSWSDRLPKLDLRSAVVPARPPAIAVLRTGQIRGTTWCMQPYQISVTRPLCLGLLVDMTCENISCYTNSEKEMGASVATIFPPLPISSLAWCTPSPSMVGPPPRSVVIGQPPAVHHARWRLPATIHPLTTNRRRSSVNCCDQSINCGPVTGQLPWVMGQALLVACFVLQSCSRVEIHDRFFVWPKDRPSGLVDRLCLPSGRRRLALSPPPSPSIHTHGPLRCLSGHGNGAEPRPGSAAQKRMVSQPRRGSECRGGLPRATTLRPGSGTPRRQGVSPKMVSKPSVCGCRLLLGAV